MPLRSWSDGDPHGDTRGHAHQAADHQPGERGPHMGPEHARLPKLDQRRAHIRGARQGQIGNPDGDDKPNKKFYDPRKWLREAEQSMIDRVKIAFEDLNCINRY